MGKEGQLKPTDTYTKAINKGWQDHRTTALTVRTGVYSPSSIKNNDCAVVLWARLV